MKPYKVILFILGILIIDQALKFFVKTNMFVGEEIQMIGDFFVLSFIENDGMAFGLIIGGKTGKIMLTLFRILAVFFIGYYLNGLIKKKAPKGLIFSIALIFAGAMGNIIDSVFYGLIFEFSSGSHRNVAEFLPEAGGYAPLLQGRVVDMLHFNFFTTELPGWIPIIGGNTFQFFRPIFNIADTSISVGVISILLFYKKFFKKKKTDKSDSETSSSEASMESEQKISSSDEPNESETGT